MTLPMLQTRLQRHNFLPAWLCPLLEQVLLLQLGQFPCWQDRPFLLVPKRTPEQNYQFSQVLANGLPHFFGGKLVTANSSSSLRLFHCLSKTYTFLTSHGAFVYSHTKLGWIFPASCSHVKLQSSLTHLCPHLGEYTLFLFILLKHFLGWELCVLCTRLLTSLLAAAIASVGNKFESVPLGSRRVLLFLLKDFSIDIWNSKPRGNRAKTHMINISSCDKNSSKCNFCETGHLLKQKSHNKL